MKLNLRRVAVVFDQFFFFNHVDSWMVKVRNVFFIRSFLFFLGNKLSGENCWWRRNVVFRTFKFFVLVTFFGCAKKVTKENTAYSPPLRGALRFSHPAGRKELAALKHLFACFPGLL